MNAEWMSRGKCTAVAVGIFFPGYGLGVLLKQGVCTECQVSRA
jgi:hypothetical protein